MRAIRILAVDDEDLIRWTLQKNLEKAGYVVFPAETGEEALRIIHEEAPDLVLLDISLPGMDGFQVLERALQIAPNLILIMVTAEGQASQIVKAMKLGAFDYITKPFDLQEIQASIEHALAAHHLKGDIDPIRQL